MQRPRHLRQLVNGAALPRFRPLDDIPAGDGNPGQRRAIALALAAEDYLLVQGPPGAGKTCTIARMVRALRARQQRVLLASFTNRAVDAMIDALDREDLEGVVRLGSGAATSAHLRFTGLMQRAAEAHLAEPEAIAALLDGAGVVAGTVATLAAAGYDAQRFDVAIVDEASQLTVPDVLAALRLARRFVLVGDDRQLPPLVQSAEAAAMEEGLATPLFTLLRDRLSEDGAEGLVMLEDQYRMNAEICAFPSQEWYEGRLKPATEEVARGRLALNLAAVPPTLRPVLDPERPVVFVDVAPLGGDVPRTSTGEACAVRDLCVALVAAGVPSHALGVIAPYRAQVALIRNLLRGAGYGDLVVDTVDRFQGSERAAMLLSLVGGTGQVGRLLQDERRLNVALTRARHKLVLLGDARELRADPLYERLLDALAPPVPGDDLATEMGI